MPVNWGLAQPQGDPLDALRYYGQAQMDTLQRQQIADTQQQRQQQMAIRQQQIAARPQIAQQVKAGDFQGARTAAVAVGDTDYASAIGGLSDAHRKQLADEAEILGRTAFGLKQLPVQQRAAALQPLIPQLKAAGYSDQEIAAAASDLSDGALDGHIAMATTLKDQLEAYNAANKPMVVSDGSEVYQNGKIVARNPKDADYIFDPESGDWLLKPGTGGTGAPAAAPAPSAAPGATNVDAVWNNMIQAESSGRPGVLGPQTPYGQAQGMTQMLPATAQQMAAKLGVPWRPELMTGKSPEAAAYQQQLGRAYFDEGLQKFDGDPRQAAMYYHGGPNQDLWGPKTNAYADKVTGGQSVPGSTPARIPSGRGAKRQQPPSGYAANPDGTFRDLRQPAPADLRKEEGNLRQEFNALPEVKDFKDVRAAYQQVKSLATRKNPTAADDISLIFSYMKLNDPSSTVREGEFATAQNAAGLEDRVRNAYNAAIRGNRLNGKQRQEFLDAAASVYLSRRDTYNSVADRYRGMAKDYGYNEGRVAPLYINQEELQRRRGGGNSQGEQITPTIRRIR